MGRKGGKRGGGGMKGFMKRTQNLTMEDDSSEGTSPSNSSSSDEASIPRPSPVETESLEASIKTETKSQMRERHKKEMNSVKKEAANLGKKKKKEATEMIEEVKQRHLQELAQFSIQPPSQDPSLTEPDNDRNEVSITHQKKSKAQKRREKEAQRELERDTRIREELEEMGTSEAELEKQRLEEKLKSKGLVIHEIRPDGHCLYRAIEHQTSNKWNVEHLRRLAAEEMRSSLNDYLPFFVHEGSNIKDAFLAYCNKVESSAEWGGELELQALAKQLKRMFIIYSAEHPDNVLGRDFELEKNSPIELCFMQHAYRLGAHYNSVTQIKTE